MLQQVVDSIKERRVSLGGAFRKFDKDSSGTITGEEFRMGLASVGLSLSEDQINGLLAASDTDHNGVLQYNEWINQLRSFRPSYTGHAGAERGTSFAVADTVLQKLYSRPENFEQTFRSIDTDGNGWVSKKEFRQALTKLGVVDSTGLAERDFKALWKGIDANGDGRMNWCEWLERMRTVQKDVRALEKYA